MTARALLIRLLQLGVILTLFGAAQSAHANCSDLADEAEAQLATAQIREDYENVLMLAQKAAQSGSNSACGVQAKSIIREVKKAIHKLDEEEKRAADEKAAKEQAKKDAEAERKKAEKDKKKKKKKKDSTAGLLDYRLSFSGEKKPKDDVIVMVDGRVVPLGYSALASTGAHELVLSPPRGDKQHAYDFEVLVDRKKLQPISASENEQVYTFDSKKGASLTLQITLVSVPADAGPKKAKKPFPWNKVFIYSGAVLLVGGGGYATWKYLEGAPKDERATEALDRCDELRGTLTCEDPQDPPYITDQINQRNDAWDKATVGAIIGGVGVGLLAVGLFVLQDPSDDTKGTASGAGKKGVKKATPSISYDVVPVVAPDNYGVFVQGSF